MSKGELVAQSYVFGKEIDALADNLLRRHEYYISGQIRRSAYSVGANIREAQQAESLRDFTHKLSISLKEANETLYWLNMLRESHKISDEKFVELRKACVSIFLMLRSAVKTSRKKLECKRYSSDAV